MATFVKGPDHDFLSRPVYWSVMKSPQKMIMMMIIKMTTTRGLDEDDNNKNNQGKDKPKKYIHLGDFFCFFFLLYFSYLHTFFLVKFFSKHSRWVIKRRVVAVCVLFDVLLCSY